MTAQAKSSDRLRGILLMVVAAAMFAGVDAFSKMLADTQSVGQIVFARYAFGIPVLIAATPLSGWPTLLRTRKLRDQIIRGLVPIVISISMVLAVRHLPLAEATVILYAGPFLVVALSHSFLGERVRLPAWIGVGVGFLAVLVVSRPGFSEISHFTIFPLVAAIFYAFFQLFTRKLGAAGELPQTTLAWTLMIGSLISAPVALATWEPLSGTGWLMMLGLGLVFGVSQILVIRAYKYAPANLLSPFSYAQVISATLLGIAFFDTVPDLWTWTGIAMIIAAGVYVMRHRGG